MNDVPDRRIITSTAQLFKDNHGRLVASVEDVHSLLHDLCYNQWHGNESIRFFTQWLLIYHRVKKHALVLQFMTEELFNYAILSSYSLVGTDSAPATSSHLPNYSAASDTLPLDALRSANVKMHIFAEETEEISNVIDHSVHSLDRVWNNTTAVDFYHRFRQWHTDFNSTIENIFQAVHELDDLVQAVQEIVQLEDPSLFEKTFAFTREPGGVHGSELEEYRDRFPASTVEYSLFNAIDKARVEAQQHANRNRKYRGDSISSGLDTLKTALLNNPMCSPEHQEQIVYDITTVSAINKPAHDDAPYDRLLDRVTEYIRERIALTDKADQLEKTAQQAERAALAEHAALTTTGGSLKENIIPGSEDNATGAKKSTPFSDKLRLGKKRKNKNTTSSSLDLSDPTEPMSTNHLSAPEDAFAFHPSERVEECDSTDAHNQDSAREDTVPTESKKLRLRFFRKKNS